LSDESVKEKPKTKTHGSKLKERSVVFHRPIPTSEGLTRLGGMHRQQESRGWEGSLFLPGVEGGKNAASWEHTVPLASGRV